MKSLRWLTPVLFVLFVGVLMAPVPSEAVNPPTVTLTPLDPVTGTPLVYPDTSTVAEINIPVTLGTCIPAVTNGVCYYLTRDTYCPDATAPGGIGQLEPGVAAPLKVRAIGSAREGFVAGSSKSNPTRLVATGLAVCTGSSANDFQKQNSWTILDYGPLFTPSDTSDDNYHARVALIDRASNSEFDKDRLGYVAIRPVVTTAAKRAKLIVKQQFAAATTKGTYSIMKESGGSWKAVGTGNYTLNDHVIFSGSGNFLVTTPQASSPIGTKLDVTVTVNGLQLRGIGPNGSATLADSAATVFSNCNYPSGTACNPLTTQTWDITINNDTVGMPGSVGTIAQFCPDPCSDNDQNTVIKNIRREAAATARFNEAELRKACGDEPPGAADCNF